MREIGIKIRVATVDGTPRRNRVDSRAAKINVSRELYTLSFLFFNTSWRTQRD